MGSWYLRVQKLMPLSICNSFPFQVSLLNHYILQAENEQEVVAVKQQSSRLELKLQDIHILLRQCFIMNFKMHELSKYTTVEFPHCD